MAFTIPAIADIGARLRDAFRAWLPGTDAWIEPNNLSVSGKAFSLGLYEAYQRILWLYRQLFASTADGEHLEKRHAAEYGLVRKPSTGAAGTAILTQVVAQPQVVPAGLVLTRGDGVRFVAAAVGNAQDGTIAVAVTCLSTGAATNTNAGTPLAVVQQADVPNLAGQAVVDANGLGGGADAETDSELRPRVLQRKQFTPMCGARGDYIRWAGEVAGVTRCFASGFSNPPPGVVVYPLFDDTRPQGIPTPADLAAVAAHVESLRPVTARVFYCAAAPQQIDVELADLEADTTANRGAIATQLAVLFAERAAVSTADAPLIFRRGWIEAAIDRALGGGGFTLKAPAGDIKIPVGTLPFLGSILYP